MKKESIKVMSPEGLHGKNLSVFINCIHSFESKIIVERGTERANAGSLMSMLALSVMPGDEITLIVDGEDEGLALCELKALIRTNFLDETVVDRICERN